MSFPETDCIRRTDQDFRSKADPEHHQKDIEGNIISTPLEELPVDLVKDIPIADSLHLLDLGIMKRCLSGWVNGSKNFKTKFFAPQIKIISTWLLDCNKRVPSDIHRSVRALNCLSFWKATEYRTFLLYLGVIILKDHLTAELYRHFLLLFCAVRICSSDYYRSNIHLAKEMLNDYIEGYISNYGIDSISSNVHNLCHLVEDVERYGSLDKISSYPFENTLGSIKNLIRSGHKPLEQVCKRLAEVQRIGIKQQPSNDHYPLLKFENTQDGSVEHFDEKKKF